MFDIYCHPIRRQGNMRNKLLSGILAAFACWFGFPNPLLHLPLLVLAFPAILGTMALGSKSPRQAFRFGFLTGMLAYSACLYWIAVPIHDYGYLPWIVAVPFPVILGSYIALHSGLFCLLLNKAAPLLCTGGFRPGRMQNQAVGMFRLALFSALAWSLLEYLRGWLFTGFPWLGLSSAFVPWPWAIQGLSALGGHALSGLYAGIAISIALGAAYFINKEKKQSALPLLGPAAFLVPALLFLAIWTCLAFSPKNDSTQAIGVILVQGNINQDQKWNPAYQQATFKHYSQLTRSALQDIARGAKRFDNISPPGTPPYNPPFKLAIWPETAMPFFYRYGGSLSRALNEFAKSEKIYLLFGAPDKEPAPGKSFSEYPIFNRTYLLNPEGKEIALYDKEHLVPFGEYAPRWMRIPALNFLLNQVGDLDQGVKTAPLAAGDIRIGMLICYEVIFQELAQKRVAEGANILATVSNDAWFGNTSAPEQHLQLGIMRAVEQGRWLLRSTNTGITSIVTPLGERSAQEEMFATKTLTGLAYTQNKTTLFHSLEPYLPYFIFFALILLLVPGYIRKKHNSN